MITLAQIKTFIVGVLKGWFTNKKTLDKLSESENGELLFDLKPIGAEETISDESIQAAIEETLTELNTDETEAGE